MAQTRSHHTHSDTAQTTTEENAFLAALFAANPHAVYSLDTEGRFTRVNPACAELTGYSRDELLGQPFLDLIADKEKTKRMRGFLRMQKYSNDQPHFIQIQHRSGNVLDLCVTHTPLIVEGVIVGFAGTAIDMTKCRENQTKREQQLLRANEELKNTLKEQQGMTVKFKKVNDRFIYTFAEGQLFQKIGIDPKRQVLGIAMEELLPESLVEYKRGFYQRAWSGEVVNYEGVLAGFPYTASLQPVFWEGKVIEVLCSLVDISELKLKEEELRETNELLESFIQHTTEAIHVTDLSGHVLRVNDSFERMFGYRSDEILGRRTELLVPENKRDELYDLRRQVADGHSVSHFETERIRKDGSLCMISLTVSPIRDMEGKVIALAAISRDITERKRHEEQIRMNNAYLESFINHTADAIGVFDLEGNLVRVNKASEEIFGWTDQDIIGRKVRTIPDDSYMQEVNYLQNIAREGLSVRGYETIRQKKDGTLIEVSITYSPIKDADGNVIAFANILRDITERKKAERDLRESEAKYRLIAENTSDMIFLLDADTRVLYASPSFEMIFGYPVKGYEGKRAFDSICPDDQPSVLEKWQESLITKKPFEVQYRAPHKNGTEVVIESRIMPITNKLGKVENLVVVARDITERQKTEEVLRNSDKLYVIGELAAGIAHEIRNPLTSIRGFIQLLKSMYTENDFYFSIMLSELDRINFIVSELLVLAKPQASNFRDNDLGQLIHNVIMLVDTQAIMNNIQISTIMDSPHYMITCEANQIKQVLINLIKNAMEAMTEGGQLIIQTEKTENNHVMLRIIDQGCGIPESLLVKLGQPFYTTKEKGTGLGLMISKKIIKDHHGALHITSTEGVGTTVEICLPLTDAVWINR
ncbi:PAS domain S-box protein [Brevibacillus dissolubilis]|uniref:PAS domain S-box protein n=1 Tax=Brevibacillus dissolubilis TaxID=1844116 RepID=UPI00159BB5CA|nr:PAS domain S-box protein [Brevibacillus dissolubilis]